MVVHLVRFEHNERALWGVLNGDVISPLSGDYPRTADLIERGQSDWTAAAGSTGNLTLAQVSLLSPVTTPCRVMCQGVNYREHAIESGMDPDARTFNLFFDKTDASVTGPNDPITRPAHVTLLDYEIELALVLRKKVAAPRHWYEWAVRRGDGQAEELGEKVCCRMFLRHSDDRVIENDGHHYPFRCECM